MTALSSKTYKVCKNIDECEPERNPCDPQAECLDVAGGFTCTCREGYSGSGLACTDVNECEVGSRARQLILYVVSCLLLSSVFYCLLSCCLLSVVCCLLSVVCCLLSVFRCLLSVVCCLLFVVCCRLSVVACLCSMLSVFRCLCSLLFGFRCLCSSLLLVNKYINNRLLRSLNHKRIPAATAEMLTRWLILLKLHPRLINVLVLFS